MPRPGRIVHVFATLSYAILAVRADFALLPDTEVVPGRYIVSLKQGTHVEILERHINWASSVHRRNAESRAISLKGVTDRFAIGDFSGYEGEFDQETIAEIEQNEDVSSVGHSYFAANFVGSAR